MAFALVMTFELTRLVTIITDESHFMPLNLEEEREKFFKDTAYNPIFSYKQPDFPIASYRQKLESYLQKPAHEDKRISGIILARVRELMHWLDLIEARGKDSFTHVCSKIYGLPSPNFVKKAREFIDLGNEDEDKRLIDAAMFKERIEKVLNNHGFDWNVAIEKGVLSRVKISASKKLMTVSSDALFSERDIKKLIVHEIKTHAIRFRNGSEQSFPFFEAGCSKYLETEEGLALYMQERCNVFFPKHKRIVGLKFLASTLCLKHSFSEVYKQIVPFTTPEYAFKVTMRVKRGLTHTGIKGGFLKDHVYLSGFLKVSSLSEEDMGYLYTGKISVYDLPVIKELVSEGLAKLFEVPKC